MIDEIINFAKNELQSKQWVVFDENIFETLTPQQAAEIVKNLDPNALMMLSEREIEFFEWIKEVDYPIWEDLWGDDSLPPYVVSVSFLPLLVYQSNANGFPICDLIHNDNYYFNIAMMNAEHSREVLESARSRFESNQKLDLHQLLALEIAFNGIDIWHFAYKYGIDVETAKLAADVLIKDKALVHYKKYDEISDFLSFHF